MKNSVLKSLNVNVLQLLFCSENILEEFLVKWAPDAVPLSHCEHLNSKMSAQVHKIANLYPTWPQLGRILAQLGLQVGSPRETPGGPLSYPWGVLSCSWGQDGPKTPQEALQDRFLSPT